MSDPWREPVRGGYPDPAFFSLPGRDQLRAMIEGRVPSPPISHLTGMRLVEVGDGTAAFEMPLTEWLCTPQGAIGIGPLVMPADGAMACAIQTALPPATPFTTSELSLRLLAPARVGSMVTVRGRLIQLRQTIALADGSMTDEQGRLIAHGSTLCFVQPALPLNDHTHIAPGTNPGEPRPDHETPDPWQQPALGETLDQHVWQQMSGLEVLLAQLGGELPASPIHHLTGLTLTHAGAGEASFEMPGSEWLCAPPRGRVQGGGVALLAESALSAAIQTKVPRATALAPIDLKINYLRPLAADGRLATAHGAVLHTGRRIAVANARVLDADGKTVAVATGSALLLAGRPASLGAAEA